MGLLDSPHYNHSLDLLRRFVPTPLRARFIIGDVRVTIETNDLSLFPVLPFDNAPSNTSEQNFNWRLVRDSDVPAFLEEPMFLRSTGVTIVNMGPACVFGVDHDRRGLVGFVGAGVDAHTYRDFLVPLLSRMTNETSGGDSPWPTESSENTANV
jgi:hypothetical protein